MKYQPALYQIILSQVNHSPLSWAKLGIFLRFLPTMLVNTTHDVSILKDRRHRQCARRQEQLIEGCSECPLLLHSILTSINNCLSDNYILQQWFVSQLFSLTLCSWTSTEKCSTDIQQLLSTSDHWITIFSLS